MRFLLSQVFLLELSQIASSVALPGELLTDAELLQERDVCTSRTDTELIGDGAPLQIKKYIQVTEPIKCANAPTCEKSNEQSESLEVSFSVEGSIEWISGGFGVAKSISTGETTTCAAEKGHTSCVFQVVAHTEYSVRECNFQLCRNPAKKCKASTRMASPNSGNAGHYAECGYDSQCKDKGFVRWERPSVGGGCKMKTKRDENGLEKRMLIC